MDRNSPDYYIEETEQSIKDTERYDQSLLLPQVSSIDCIPEFETAGQGLISWLDQHLTKCAAFALQTSVNS